MPERYRDPRTGHWVSPSNVPNLEQYMRELYEDGLGGKLAERYTVGIDLPTPTNWTDTEWPGGGVVREAGGQELSGDALDESSFPPGAASFQLRFIMPDNPDYPRGWASYSTLDASDWDNVLDIVDSAIDQKGALGVGAIIFHRYF